MTTLTPATISWSQIVDRQTGLLTPGQNGVVKDTRVLMLGIGGMGMNAAAQLVRAGFENFTLVDFDVVDGTSANRTPFAFDDTVGLQKVEATKRYMLKINPAARIQVHPNVKLTLGSDPAYMDKLVRDHDVLSWAMDGIAGRIYYTRIAHRIGQACPKGKPAVESWGIPFHFCAWTIPNARGTAGWEEQLGLPTAGRELAGLQPADLAAAQREQFRRFASVPGLLEALDPELMKRWLKLEISNRTLGAFVAGCASLIAYEVLLNALELGGLPLAHTESRRAPWMALYDVRRNVAYDYNFITSQVRWRHPVTNRMTVEPAVPAVGAANRG